MSMLAPGPMASTVLAGFASSSSSTTAVGSPALSKQLTAAVSHCPAGPQQYAVANVGVHVYATKDMSGLYLLVELGL